MLTCISLASYTQICPNREEAKKSVCFTFSKPDGTPLTAFRKVPEKIGPGKKYRYRKNLVPEKSTGSGTEKIWSRKKVPVPVPEKIGPGKKYRYRYRKNLVPEKSTGTGTEKIWSRKKVPVPVPEKIGPGKKYRYRYRKKLVPEKSTGTGIGKNWSQYRRIPGNSQSLYILISSCTF